MHTYAHALHTLCSTFKAPLCPAGLCGKEMFGQLPRSERFLARGKKTPRKHHRSGAAFRPWWVLFQDDNDLVLSIRGSANMDDIATDLACANCEFLHGHAHEGMAGAVTAAQLCNSFAKRSPRLGRSWSGCHQSPRVRALQALHRVWAQPWRLGEPLAGHEAAGRGPAAGGGAGLRSGATASLPGAQAARTGKWADLGHQQIRPSPTPFPGRCAPNGVGSRAAGRSRHVLVADPRHSGRRRGGRPQVRGLDCKDPAAAGLPANPRGGHLACGCLCWTAHSAHRFEWQAR
ncbi:unnamed protein product [Effrenium voratum]|nr:unnamed protein product [Effrenium voratum]